MSTQNHNTVDHNQACTTQMPTSVAQTALNPISTIRVSKLTCGPLHRCNKCANLYTFRLSQICIVTLAFWALFEGPIPCLVTLAVFSSIQRICMKMAGWSGSLLSLWALFLLRVRKKTIGSSYGSCFCFAGAVVIKRSMEEQATCIFYNLLFGVSQRATGFWLRSVANLSLP